MDHYEKKQQLSRSSVPGVHSPPTGIPETGRQGHCFFLLTQDALLSK